MNRSTPGLPVHHQLSEFTQTHVCWVSDAIQPSHPLSSTSPPALNLSLHQGIFKWVSSSHQVAKILEFHLQHRLSYEHPGLISFRMDWLDLFAAQGTFKSLLQHHSSKALICHISLWSNSHIHTWLLKNHSFDYMDFVSKVIFLLFNMLSRLIIAFLPRSKCLLI